MSRRGKTPCRRLSVLIAALAFLPIALPGAPLRAQEATPPESETMERESPEREKDDDLLEPSNTGYIDGAVIRSQMRIRYDSALDADRPDRAEFFYGKCSCFTFAAGQDSASPGPAAALDDQEVELSLEGAVSRRLSLFLEIPFRSTELTVPEGFDDLLGLPSRNLDNSGLGDVRAGVKYALVAAPGHFLTLQIRGYFPTGDAGDNLGTDHASIEPGLLHFARLTDRWTVSSELRWWHPLSGSSDPVTGASDETSPVGRIELDGRDPAVSNDDFAGDVLRFGLGASYEARGRRLDVSPVVELVGWYVVDGFATPPTPREERAGPNFGFLEEADGDTIVNLKLGARLQGTGPASVYVGYGVALSDDVWYEDILRIEYRYTF
jgi:hypothetical protein